MVHIDFRKWPDARHWQFSMERLGEDEHGVWLWSPPGTIVRRADESPKVNRAMSVKVITHDAWWTAVWNDKPDGVHLYVDIATPAQWNGDRVTLIDLDLDVYQPPGGEIMILDEDEFAEHQVTLGYPAHLIDKARTATAAVALQVERGEPLFDATVERWIERARTLSSA